VLYPDVAKILARFLRFVMTAWLTSLRLWGRIHREARRNRLRPPCFRRVLGRWRNASFRFQELEPRRVTVSVLSPPKRRVLGPFFELVVGVDPRVVWQSYGARVRIIEAEPSGDRNKRDPLDDVV